MIDGTELAPMSRPVTNTVPCSPIFGSMVTPTPSVFSIARRSALSCGGRTGAGDGAFKSPLAAGRSARMAYCWIGLVNRMAPLSLPACAFIAASSRPGIQTGVATMRPAVAGDQPRG